MLYIQNEMVHNYGMHCVVLNAVDMFEMLVDSHEYNENVNTWFLSNTHNITI